MFESSNELEYINNILDAYEDNSLDLILVELKNNEKVIALVDNKLLSEGIIEELLLPIHLVDNFDVNKIVYSLYPYFNIARTVASLNINEYNLYTLPTEKLISNYTIYWEKHINDLKSNAEQNVDQDMIFDIVTKTLS